MKLWIDDLREPPEGWLWAKTSEEAIAFLRVMTFDEISFDHDLGGDDTTRPVVNWICENGFHFPPICRVHTANNVGREWLEGTIKRYSNPGTLQRW